MAAHGAGSGEAAAAPPALRLDEAAAREIVDQAIVRYFASRRALVRPFVDRTFSLRGTLGVHREAVGWDMLRAPANVALILPTIVMRLAGAGARKAGAADTGRWLESRNLFMETDVGREIEWRLHAELLELPYRQGDRAVTRDALAEAIFADPRVTAGLEAGLVAIRDHVDEQAFRDRLTDALAVYAGTRAAAADIATAVMAAGVGAVAFHKLTPGALSFGPALAAALAQHAAISSFPLGAGIGGLWYGVFPASATFALTAATTTGLMGVAALLSAFAGVVADPVQRRLGLHRRRLERMLDALERQFRGDAAARYVVRDHYVTRLLDLFDALRIVYRAAG